METRTFWGGQKAFTKLQNLESALAVDINSQNANLLLPMEKEDVYTANSSPAREREGEMTQAGRIIDLHVAVRLKDEAWERYMSALDAYQERKTQGTLRE